MRSVAVVRHVVLKRCWGFAWSSSYAVGQSPHPPPEHFGVPSLSQSIDKYLAYTKPLVPSEQWKETCRIVSTYVSSPYVARLQYLLEKRAKMEDNWLFDWWLTGYLSYRVPVVVHSSPGMKMRTMNFRSDEEWLAHAASIIYGLVKYKTQLESHSLPTEYFTSGEAMCMGQYYALLANCRIPGMPHDRLLSRRGSPHTTSAVNHVCVLYRNRCFRLEFRDSVTHEPASPGLLYRQLEHIVSTVRKLPVAPPVGILTSLPRDEWCRVHAMMRQDTLNASAFTELERSLIVLCLDDSANLPTQSIVDDENSHLCVLDERETVSSENALHGNLVNSGNRWFDKSVQFIVSRDGSIGVNFEHTAADAGALVPIVSEVYGTFGHPVPLGVDRLPVYAHPKELNWRFRPSINRELEQASCLLEKLIDSVEVQYGAFKGFGSSSIKKHKVSPDAFVQMALQLAYFRLHPTLPPPPTYESGSLRRFHLGRTDTIRSCSQESVQFTHGMQDSKVPPAECANLLRTALKRHQDYTHEVVTGQAFDRHLLGLRHLAASLDKPSEEEFKVLQSLFTDPTYTLANTYRLSTSQVRSPDDVAVLFGPVIDNGYGFCYNIHSNSIQFTASSFRTSSETASPAQLLLQVSHALNDMFDLLSKHSL
ncbi:hypothetical protein P879_06809 [Paragonimus westermani]|uniref:Choline/carnitine acyltransferase domain-containing protein n=1 Tax=Paragonimus westermani TaxID=34504 RepID=A0A8T0D7U3_9TREM|nr:hypothetical protein P879_06809 [Paragonimus westermani]